MKARPRTKITSGSDNDTYEDSYYDDRSDNGMGINASENRSVMDDHDESLLEKSNNIHK